MPIRSPWVRYAAAFDEGKEYLAMVSYFRLKELGAMPRFLWNALRVGRQLGRSEGLLYYSTGARLGSLEFWSVSVWKDERALGGFVRASPHSEIMEAMLPHVRRSEFVRWRETSPLSPGSVGFLMKRSVSSSKRPPSVFRPPASSP